MQNWEVWTELWQNTVEAFGKWALEIYILKFAFLRKPICISAAGSIF